MESFRPSSIPVVAGELVGRAVLAAVVLVLAAGAVPRAVAPLPRADHRPPVGARQLTLARTGFPFLVLCRCKNPKNRSIESLPLKITHKKCVNVL